jgi:hypothetical protein
MTEVSQYDVDIELDRKRTRIRQVVSKKLSTLDFYSYIKLISGIAEKLYENDQLDVGYILSDLFQDYQIKTKDAVTNELNDIHQRIEHITANYDPDSEVDVTLIIKKLDHWKLLAHPIQILEQFNGTSFEENNALCRYLNEVGLLKRVLSIKRLKYPIKLKKPFWTKKKAIASMNMSKQFSSISG